MHFLLENKKKRKFSSFAIELLFQQMLNSKQRVLFYSGTLRRFTEMDPCSGTASLSYLGNKVVFFWFGAEETMIIKE